MIFKTSRIIIQFIFILGFIVFSHVSAAEKYGPTKPSDSLWKIAKSLPTNGAHVKTTQIVYAIYKMNPDAFNSGNMNELKKGVYLKLPQNMQGVALLSYENAEKEYKAHLQQLDLLQVSAKDLANAKSQYAKWKRRARRLERRVRSNVEMTEREAHKLSARLKSASRKKAKWKREVRKLRHLLAKKAKLDKIIAADSEQNHVLESSSDKQKKALLEDTKKADLQEQADRKQTANSEHKIATTQSRVKLSLSKPEVVVQKQEDVIQKGNENTELKLRLNELESQLNTLQEIQKKSEKSREEQITELENKLKKSETYLQTRLKKQAEMEERLSVLEGELGRKELLIQKMQTALSTAAETMKQQQLENDKLQAALARLGVEKSTSNKGKRLELTEAATPQDAIFKATYQAEKKEKSEHPESDTKQATMRVQKAEKISQLQIKPNTSQTTSPIKAQKEAIQMEGMETEGVDRQSSIKLLFIISILFLLSLLAFFHLKRLYRQRKYRKRMEVLELKLKPIKSRRKPVDNPFKKTKETSEKVMLEGV